MKRKPSIELPDTEVAVELAVSQELPGESFGLLFDRETSVFDRKKWCSLTLSLLMHGVLAIALCFAVRTQIPRNFQWIQVQLVASPGGSTGNGSGSPAAAAEIFEESSPSEEPSPPVPVPEEPAQPTVPVTHEPAQPPVPEEIKTPENAPVQTVEPYKAPAVAPVKERKLKKAVKPVARAPKEEPANKPEQKDVNVGIEPGIGSGSVTMEGPGAGIGGTSGTGAGPPALQPGNGEAGPPRNGPIDFAFGSPGGPRFLRKVMPVYPDFERRQEREGTVVLRVIIDEEGRVTHVEVLKKAGAGFDEVAVKAIRESTFSPAKKDGKSVCCRALIPIRFELKTSM